jgi:uncharacterized protein (UPF0332 family)
MWFDFRRNKALAYQHVRRAKEYYETAKDAFKKGTFAPCVDNLFNAAELSAKAVLLVAFDYQPSLRRKARHQGIQMRYNRFANLGNVMPNHKAT